MGTRGIVGGGWMDRDRILENWLALAHFLKNARETRGSECLLRACVGGGRVRNANSRVRFRPSPPFVDCELQLTESKGFEFHRILQLLGSPCRIWPLLG